VSYLAPVSPKAGSPVSFADPQGSAVGINVDQDLAQDDGEALQGLLWGRVAAEYVDAHRISLKTL
jgi:hypothetical protein